MNRKILAQIRDCFRQTPLHPDQQIVLGLQLIAWTLLCTRRQIKGHLTTEKFLGSLTDEVPSTISGLEELPDPIGQAFAGSSRAMVTAGAKAMRTALELCQKLEIEGLLQNFSPIGEVSELFAETRMGPFGCAPALNELIAGLAQIRKAEAAYCAWDESGQLSGCLLPLAKIVFAENQVFSPLPALVNVLVGGELESHFGNPIQSPAGVTKGKLSKFDVAVAIPPFGLSVDPTLSAKDLFDRFTIPKATWSALTVQHLLARATRRVVVAVPNSLLFGPGTDRTLREQLVADGRVQAVIALPGGLLQRTNMAATLLVLSPNQRHESVRFVNADDDRFRATNKARSTLTDVAALVALALGRGDDDCVADVPMHDVLANEAQLQVSRYVVPQQQKRLQAALAKMERVTLADLVETIRPVITNASQTDGAIQVHEVAAADLPRYGYVSGTSRPMYVDPDAFTKGKHQLLLPNDIVLITKGSAGKVGIIPPDVPTQGPEGWVPVQSATVLRLRPSANVDAKTLFLLLRSSFGQQLMATITSGAAIPFISLRELLRLEVPIPTREKMAQAAEVLESEAIIQADIDALQRLQATKAEDLWSFE